jgi:glutathione S-transferase
MAPCHFLERFERHMTGREWVATQHFSLADITAAVALDFARVLRVDAYGADHPATAAWRARLAERPAFGL